MAEKMDIAKADETKANHFTTKQLSFLSDWGYYFLTINYCDL